MHEYIFTDAAIPTPVECLNVPLAPYSVRHELILLRHRSPFLCQSEAEFNALTHPEQVFAIMLAVQTCAAKRIWFPWLWRKFIRREDYPLAIAEFRNYLAAGRALLPTLSPSVKEDADAYEIANNGEKMTSGRSLGAPLLAQLINFGIREFRLSYDDVLDTPLAHLANLYFAHLESNSCMSIENGAEADARAQMARNLAEVESETASAEAAWRAATTPEAQAAAFAAHPRIGSLFAKAWHTAETEEAQHALVKAWGIVAETELQRAGLDPKTFKPITEESCPA
jgi:hypothetical protein